MRVNCITGLTVHAPLFGEGYFCDLYRFQPDQNQMESLIEHRAAIEMLQSTQRKLVLRDTVFITYLQYVPVSAAVLQNIIWTSATSRLRHKYQSPD